MEQTQQAVQAIVTRWHEAVNEGDVRKAENAVSDPVVVLGPQGVGSISPQEFADWVLRSGIRMVPQSWTPVGERLVVVEAQGTWPQSGEPSPVATVFRVTGGRVSAALRMPDFPSALQLAHVCRELAASQ